MRLAVLEAGTEQMDRRHLEPSKTVIFKVAFLHEGGDEWPRLVRYVTATVSFYEAVDN